MNAATVQSPAAGLASGSWPPQRPARLRAVIATIVLIVAGTAGAQSLPSLPGPSEGPAGRPPPPAMPGGGMPGDLRMGAGSEPHDPLWLRGVGRQTVEADRADRARLRDEARQRELAGQAGGGLAR